MKTIKLLLRENLEKQYFINETIKRISTYKNINERRDAFVGLISKLINEGHNDNEIDELLNEQDTTGFFNGFTSFNDESSNKNDTLGNAASIATGSVSTQFREWMLKSLLELCGVSEFGASIIGAAFSRMSLSDLREAYQSKRGCYTNSQSIATGLSSALLTAVFDPTSLAGNYIKHATVNYMVKSGTEREFGKYLCDAFFKYKNRNNPEAQSEPLPNSKQNFHPQKSHPQNTVTAVKF